MTTESRSAETGTTHIPTPIPTPTPTRTPTPTLDFSKRRDPGRDALKDGDRNLSEDSQASVLSGSLDSVHSETERIPPNYTDSFKPPGPKTKSGVPPENELLVYTQPKSRLTTSATSTNPTQSESTKYLRESSIIRSRRTSSFKQPRADPSQNSPTPSPPPLKQQPSPTRICATMDYSYSHAITDLPKLKIQRRKAELRRSLHQGVQNRPAFISPRDTRPGPGPYDFIEQSKAKTPPTHSDPKHFEPSQSNKKRLISGGSEETIKVLFSKPLVSRTKKLDSRIRKFLEKPLAQWTRQKNREKPKKDSPVQ